MMMLKHYAIRTAPRRPAHYSRRQTWTAALLSAFVFFTIAYAIGVILHEAFPWAP